MRPTTPGPTRRHVLQSGIALAGARAAGVAAGGVVAGCAAPGVSSSPPSLGRVVVIGGGFGGATAARHLRAWSAGRVEVVLVERQPAFVSCPLSNLVLGGSRRLDDLRFGYRGLQAQGVRVVQGEVVAVDVERRRVRVDGMAEDLAYDRLIVSPGVDFLEDAVEGLAASREFALHAWKAGAQTVALRQALVGMRPGGVFVLTVPRAPYRCPPGPYERVCQVASHLRQHNPRAKLVVLDANEDIVSKGPLFKAAWDSLYPGLVEVHPSSEVVRVDATLRSVQTAYETVRCDVLNLIPPMRAGDIALRAGLVNANGRWCGVDWTTMESTARPGVHVLGDATLAASAMPKSGHMANQHGKLAAGAVLALLRGEPVDTDITIANTCYSFVSDREAVHVASVHRYDPQRRTLLPVPGAGGVSAQRSVLEGTHAEAWARSIWHDTLGS